MLYNRHFAGAPGVGPSFNVTVDDETMTWRSDPPGNKIEKPMMMAFSSCGSIGSGKSFTIFPDGAAELP